MANFEYELQLFCGKHVASLKEGEVFVVVGGDTPSIHSMTGEPAKRVMDSLSLTLPIPESING